MKNTLKRLLALCLCLALPLSCALAQEDGLEDFVPAELTEEELAGPRRAERPATPKAPWRKTPPTSPARKKPS